MNQTRSGWKSILVGAAVWLLAMLLLQWASNWKQAYRQRAAQVLKDATLIYVEPVPAAEQEPKLRRARQAFEDVATRFPNTEAGSVARFYSIRISYRLKEWEKAESDLNVFIKQGNDPDDYVIRAMEVRYQIYRAGGEMAKASDYFREVVEADLER
jgi:tetratricopeptide (TPR) repeat protein